MLDNTKCTEYGIYVHPLLGYVRLCIDALYTYTPYRYRYWMGGVRTLSVLCPLNTILVHTQQDMHACMA